MITFGAEPKKAVPHKHGTMQIFLSVKENPEIIVEGERISCGCAL